MDFAIASGITGYDDMLRRLYINRASTTVIDLSSVVTMKDFVDHLNGASAAHPTRWILVGSHGDDNAFMKMQWDSNTGPNTTWEDLNAAHTSHNTEVNDAVIGTPRQVDAAGAVIPARLLIKGCRIAVSQPFMTKLKEAINGASGTSITVTAPKFYHRIEEAITKGFFELFMYDFGHVSKTPVASKAALITALLARSYTDIHGTAITQAQYQRWIPRNFAGESDPIQAVNFSPAPVTALPRLRTGRYRHQYVTIYQFTIDTTAAPLPAGYPARIAAVKAVLASIAATPTTPLDESLASTHAFPYYTRFGYTSLDDMVDNLQWQFSIQSADEALAVGKRHEYDVNPPIVAAGSDNVIFNYYATAGSGTTSAINFDDTDSRFYITT